MMRFKCVVPLAVLAAMAFLAGGCEDQKQMKIDALTRERDALAIQARDLQDKLARSEDEKTGLLSQISQKDGQIASLQAQLKKGGGTGSVTGAGSAEGWEVGLYGDRVTLESDILFSSGKATLTPAGKGKLDKVAADLKAKYGGLPVRVYGFTDTDPIRKTKNLWSDNLDLSANRAMTVTRYLVGKGVSAKTVETVAMGEWHPAKDKAKSRRVEIVVVKKPSGLTAGPRDVP